MQKIQILKKRFILFLLLVTGLLSLFVFQNCGKRFESAAQFSESSTAPDQVQSILGNVKKMNLGFYSGQEIVIEPNLDVDLSQVQDINWILGSNLISTLSGSQIFQLPAPSALKSSLFLSFNYNSKNYVTQVAELTIKDDPKMPVAPVILIQPEGVALTAGSRATLSVAQLASPVATVQWYKDGKSLDGKTKNFLSLKNLSRSDAGNYYAVIKNSQGSVTSDVASIVLNKDFLPPKILNTISNLDLLVGDSFITHVEFEGVPTPAAKWYFNGAELALERTSVLRIASLLAEHAGNYKVVVSSSHKGKTYEDSREFSITLKCLPGNHLESGSCTSDSKNCSITNGTGTQIWAGSSYTACQLASCNSSFHVEGNQCLSNVNICTITNGTGTQLWSGSTYGSCQVASCHASFHIENNQCMSNVKSCTMANGNGTQTWTGSIYGSCQVASCNANFHSESNQCVSDAKACTVANGTGVQNWNGSSYGSCLVSACNNSFHVESGQCMSNAKSCPLPNGTGVQTWNGSAYGACGISSCSANYHQESNQCVSDAKACTVANGTGVQNWNGSSYGSCLAAACNNGFHVESGQCISNAKSCPVPNGTGVQTWNGAAYGACGISSCSANYHQESNQCVSDAKACTVANGAGVQKWNGSSYGSCLVSACNNSFHVEGGQCLADIKACAVPNGNGNQNWNGSSYGTCQPTACNINYHIENNQCVSNTRSCGITNGSGTQAWNGSGYGACQISACNSGYHAEAGQCASNTRACGVGNGSGTQAWNGSGYGACQISACNSGYHAEVGQCLSNTQSCIGGGLPGTKSWNGSDYGVCVVCSYGQSQSCLTTGGLSGSQACAADGSAFGTCSIACSPGAWSNCKPSWSNSPNGFRQCNAAGTDFGICGDCKPGDTRACQTGIRETPNGKFSCIVDNAKGNRFSSSTSACTPISSGSPGFCTPGEEMGDCIQPGKSEWSHLGNYAKSIWSTTTKSYTTYGTQVCNSAGTGSTCKVCDPGQINFVSPGANIKCNSDGKDYSEPRLETVPCSPGDYFKGWAGDTRKGTQRIAIKACAGGGVYGSWLPDGKCIPGDVSKCGQFGLLRTRCDSSLTWGPCSK